MPSEALHPTLAFCEQKEAKKLLILNRWRPKIAAYTNNHGQ
jgi:hypothetical protein